MNKKIAFIPLIVCTLCSSASDGYWCYPKNTTNYSNNNWQKNQTNTDCACRVDDNSKQYPNSYNVEAGYFLVDLGSTIDGAPQYACAPIYQDCSNGYGQQLNLAYLQTGTSNTPPVVYNGGSISWSNCYVSSCNQSNKCLFPYINDYNDCNITGDTCQQVKALTKATGITYGTCDGTINSNKQCERTGNCADLPDIQRCQTTWHDGNVSNTIYGEISGQYTATVGSSNVVEYDYTWCTCTVQRYTYSGWDGTKWGQYTQESDCASDNRLKDTCNKVGGKVSGTYEGPENNNCICKYSVDGENGTFNVIRTGEYIYISGTYDWEWNEATYTAKCDDGHYLKSGYSYQKNTATCTETADSPNKCPTTCTIVPKGKYIDNPVTITDCPIGSTTDGDGAGTIRQACHLTGDTVFKDNNGSFSISDLSGLNATATDNTK